MKTTRFKKEETSYAEIYKARMEQFHFMNEFLGDPEIFKIGSLKFKTFLIHSFANLQAEFHYLSFLSNEDIDRELKKALEILQILPIKSSKKSDKIFDNWLEKDTCQFWERFFSLFNKEEMKQFEAECNLEAKNEIFKDLNTAMHYLNYEFPIISMKKIMQITIDNEIEKWNDEPSINVPSIVEDSTVHNFEGELLFNINVEKLIADLKQIILAYKRLHIVEGEIKTADFTFFGNFIDIVQDVLKYSKNLSLIDWKLFSDTFLCKYVENTNEDKFSNNLDFLRTYRNLINVLQLKLHSFY